MERELGSVTFNGRLGVLRERQGHLVVAFADGDEVLISAQEMRRVLAESYDLHEPVDALPRERGA